MELINAFFVLNVQNNGCRITNMLWEILCMLKRASHTLRKLRNIRNVNHDSYIYFIFSTFYMDISIKASRNMTCWIV